MDLAGQIDVPGLGRSTIRPVHDRVGRGELFHAIGLLVAHNADAGLMHLLDLAPQDGSHLRSRRRCCDQERVTRRMYGEPPSADASSQRGLPNVMARNYPLIIFIMMLEPWWFEREAGDKVI